MMSLMRALSLMIYASLLRSSGGKIVYGQLPTNAISSHRINSMGNDHHNHDNNFSFVKRKEQSIHNNNNSHNRNSPTSTSTHDTINMSPKSFSTMCINFLLDVAVIYDGIISTDDIAKFYEDLCTNLSIEVCKDEMTPFHQMSLPLQLSFIHSLCGKEDFASHDDYLNCIDVLRAQVDQRDEFGLEINSDNFEVVEGVLDGYCTSSYPYARSNLHLGTYEPEPEIITSESFIDMCMEYLMNIQVIYDGIISTTDVTGFYENLCDSYNIESCMGKTIQFHTTSLPLQFAFLNTLCSREDFATKHEFENCIGTLRIQAKQSNVFGLEINQENQHSVEESLLGYCTEAFPLARSHFHLGTYAPSTSPSVYHSYQPSSSHVPTPTVASKPRPVKQNTSSHRVSFTYMIGFLSNDDVQNVLNEDTSNILASLMKTVSSILSSTSTSDIARNNVVFSNVSQVQNKVTIAATCVRQFTISSDCILIVSDVDVKANETETSEDVALSVYSTMLLSMDDDSFRQELNKEIVVEVKYIQNGQIDFPIRDIAPSRTDGLIAILAIGSFVLCVPCLLLMVGCARARESSAVDDDELDDDDDEAYLDEEDDNNFVDAYDVQRLDINEEENVEIGALSTEEYEDAAMEEHEDIVRVPSTN